MNTNKKLIYTMVCALALQAAVPAQANIWSSVVQWWNHVPEQSKRTAGIVTASVTALFVLGYSAYALCKKKKKAGAMPAAPVVNVPVVVQGAMPQQAAAKVVADAAHGSLNMMQHITSESTPAFNAIAQIYDDVYVPFKKHVYEPQVVKYRTHVEQQNFKGAFITLREIRSSYMRAVDPLSKKINTLKKEHKVKLLAGHSKAMIRSELAHLTVLSNAVSEIPTFVATECQKLEREIEQRKLAKRQRSEGESKRAAA